MTAIWAVGTSRVATLRHATPDVGRAGVLPPRRAPYNLACRREAEVEHNLVHQLQLAGLNTSHEILRIQNTKLISNYCSHLREDFLLFIS